MERSMGQLQAALKLVRAGDYSGAARIYADEVAANCARQKNGEKLAPHSTTRLMTSLAQVHLQQGNRGAAHEWSSKAVELYRQHPEPESCSQGQALATFLLSQSCDGVHCTHCRVLRTHDFAFARHPKPSTPPRPIDKLPTASVSPTNTRKVTKRMLPLAVEMGSTSIRCSVCEQTKKFSFFAMKAVMLHKENRRSQLQCKSCVQAGIQERKQLLVDWLRLHTNLAKGKGPSKATTNAQPPWRRPGFEATIAGSGTTTTSSSSSNNNNNNNNSKCLFAPFQGHGRLRSPLPHVPAVKTFFERGVGQLFLPQRRMPIMDGNAGSSLSHSCQKACNQTETETERETESDPGLQVGAAYLPAPILSICLSYLGLPAAPPIEPLHSCDDLNLEDRLCKSALGLADVSSASACCRFWSRALKRHKSGMVLNKVGLSLLVANARPVRMHGLRRQMHVPDADTDADAEADTDADAAAAAAADADADADIEIDADTGAASGTASGTSSGTGTSTGTGTASTPHSLMQSTSYLQLDRVPSKNTGLQGVAAATGMAQPPTRF